MSSLDSTEIMSSPDNKPLNLDVNIKTEHLEAQINIHEDTQNVVSKDTCTGLNLHYLNTRARKALKYR